MRARGLTESIVEDATLAWFQALGYAWRNGADITPHLPEAERADSGQTLLVGRLRPALARLNPTLPPGALDEAFRKLTRTGAPALVQGGKNAPYHKLFSADINPNRMWFSSWPVTSPSILTR